MPKQDITVSNRLGLHARAAAKLVQRMQGFDAEVWLCAKDRDVNGKSIMGVMMLAASLGSSLTVRTEGQQAEAALEAVIDLFQNKFNETE